MLRRGLYGGFKICCSSVDKDSSLLKLYLRVLSVSHVTLDETEVSDAVLFALSSCSQTGRDCALCFLQTATAQAERGPPDRTSPLALVPHPSGQGNTCLHVFTSNQSLALNAMKKFASRRWSCVDSAL